MSTKISGQAASSVADKRQALTEIEKGCVALLAVDAKLGSSQIPLSLLFWFEQYRCPPTMATPPSLGADDGDEPRIARDGRPYTRLEFKEYYGEHWYVYWGQASIATAGGGAHPPAAVAGAPPETGYIAVCSVGELQRCKCMSVSRLLLVQDEVRPRCYDCAKPVREARICRGYARWGWLADQVLRCRQSLILYTLPVPRS